MPFIVKKVEGISAVNMMVTIIWSVTLWWMGTDVSDAPVTEILKG
jgi:hypothetical protein